MPLMGTMVKQFVDGNSITLNGSSITALCQMGLKEIPAGEFVFFEYGVDFSPGTGTTTLFLQLLQGAGTGGVQTGQAFIPVPAGLPRMGAAGICTDSSALERIDMPYTLCATATGASANGTINACELRCFWNVR